jgi:hypothetical protein
LHDHPGRACDNHSLDLLPIAAISPVVIGLKYDGCAKSVGL